MSTRDKAVTKTPNLSRAVKSSSGSDWKDPSLNVAGAAADTSPSDAPQRRQDRRRCGDGDERGLKRQKQTAQNGQLKDNETKVKQPIIKP